MDLQRRCFVQPLATTPKPVWDPDRRRSDDFFAQWQEVPDNEEYHNGFATQWELFIKHVCDDAPFAWDFLAGARGVQLAELGMESWRERRWVDVPKLEV